MSSCKTPKLKHAWNLLTKPCKYIETLCKLLHKFGLFLHTHTHTHTHTETQTHRHKHTHTHTCLISYMSLLFHFLHSGCLSWCVCFCFVHMHPSIVCVCVCVRVREREREREREWEREGEGEREEETEMDRVCGWYNSWQRIAEKQTYQGRWRDIHLHLKIPSGCSQCAHCGKELHTEITVCQVMPFDFACVCICICVNASTFLLAASIRLATKLIA